MPMDYVFGYGSLINAVSRHTTTDDVGPAVVGEVAGLRRRFNAQVRHRPPPGASFLGVVEATDAICTGVAYPVPDGGLVATDERESSYRRVPVARPDFTRLGGAELPEDTRLWTYLFDSDDPPCEAFPITQHYVDLCVGGCLQIEQTLDGMADFAERFITGTDFWNRHWVNDRLVPRAPWRHEPLALQIDSLLLRLVPDALAGRAIE